MRFKITQNEFFIFFFSTISIILLFVPFQKTEFPFFQDPRKIWGIDEGSYREDSFETLPWRSYNQEINLNLNIIEGNITFLVLDSRMFRDWFYNKTIEPYLLIVNITKTLNTRIFIYPPINSLCLLYIAEEFTLVKIKVFLSYTFFHSNYGFFFLSIAAIFIGYYLYKKIKLRH